MDEILKFISGSGDGYGSGDGSGSGYGYGSGDGSGDGDGYGSGDGSGAGYGYGYSDGSGSGYGSGDGSGSGYGGGSGDGYGSGDGSGAGYGGGSGDGSGDGDGSGIKISFADSFPVTYIDGIPCIVRSAHSRWANISVIRTDDFTLEDAFVGRYETAIAHGGTIREAIEAARKKYFSGLDFGGQKERLLAEFAEKKRLSVKDLYQWHGILTGSCEYGRSLFQCEHGLKDDELLTLEEFVELTKGAYGGDRIAALLES